MKNKLFRRAAVLIAARRNGNRCQALHHGWGGTVVDNATDEDGTEFFTITTPPKNENVFHLIIDRQRTEENVYFLNAVTEKDLLTLAEPEPEPEKDAGFPIGNLLMIAAVLLVGGGAAYYFKVYRPKHEAPEAGRGRLRL